MTVMWVELRVAPKNIPSPEILEVSQCDHLTIQSLCCFLYAMTELAKKNAQRLCRWVVADLMQTLI